MSEDSANFENQSLGEFDKKQSEMLKNKNLNPQPGRVKGFLARTAAAAGILGGTLFGSAVAEEKYGDDVRNTAGGIVDSIQDKVDAAQDKIDRVDEIVTGDENIGKPYGDGIPVIVDLVQVENGEGKLIDPTFRTTYSTDGDELTEDELSARGISLDSLKGIATQEIIGDKYGENPLLPVSQTQIEKDGKTYGKWYKILRQSDDPEGAYFDTEVYVAGNFVTNAEKVKVEEGQEIKIIPLPAKQE